MKIKMKIMRRMMVVPVSIAMLIVKMRMIINNKMMFNDNDEEMMI
jgi:hypothetical protein